MPECSGINPVDVMNTSEALASHAIALHKNRCQSNVGTLWSLLDPEDLDPEWPADRSPPKFRRRRPKKTEEQSACQSTTCPQPIPTTLPGLLTCLLYFHLQQR